MRSSLITFSIAVTLRSSLTENLWAEYRHWLFVRTGDGVMICGDCVREFHASLDDSGADNADV